MRKYEPGGVAVAKKSELISVKIEPDVYRLIRTVAAWKGENISEYLSEAVRPVAQRDFDRMKAAGRAKEEHDE